MTREITGTIDGDSVRIRSAYGEQHGDSVNLTFTGKVTGDQMSGALDMGEYLGATWTATRRSGAEGMMNAVVRRDAGWWPALPFCCPGCSPSGGSSQRSLQPAGPKYDLLLRGGHVIDARNKHQRRARRGDRRRKDRRRRREAQSRRRAEDGRRRPACT